MGLDLANRIRNVTAVLGPTNTGKTHLAIERMLGHETGLIGLPLRLLAREVYDKIVARVGAANVALITGEEKIKPENPRYYVCTVEAMPRDADVDFLAIDEIQLAADPERGHVFTDRLLHVRGKQETLMLGAQTMRETISGLIPGANFISRPRLSKLTYSGEKKITRLPPRSAVVAFSASEVYTIAELIRRQRGGAAVVLGALSPRTRNAQVALYQSGDVDFLVATDAIGMGLNLDVEHVAFAGTRKFDGHVHRDLTPAELAQIAGRAGRHMNDGTFGVTGSVEPLGADVIERLENHTFDTVKSVQWRSRELDFGSVDRLRDSLREAPREMRLARARMSDDTLALENVSHDREVMALAIAPAAIERLWEVCQIPDYRKISPQNHAELVGTLYKFLMAPQERIPVDWFAKQVAFADRTDGDIDTLANRIAHIRTWTFVSNRADWLADPEHWQEQTRQIENNLSDALHERLAARFIDKRTSALMKGLKDKDELYAEIGEDGSVQVERHFVGKLQGFRFFPAADAEGIHGKATRSAAAHVLSKELSMRVRRVVAAKNDAFKLTRDAAVLWRDEEIARLEPGEDPLKPLVSVLADEHLAAPDKDRVKERLTTWITTLIAERLKPLVELRDAQDIAGLARGIAFRMLEGFGILRREAVAEEIRTLDQPARAQLRKYGVRFGAFNIYFPILLKPASTELALTLWRLKNAALLGAEGKSPEPPRAGLTSFAADAGVPDAFYRVAGFHLCGGRAVRIDMLERLADQIRPLVAWRPDPANPAATPPKGASGDGGFRAGPEMMSILGCSGDELREVLKALGFWADRRPLPSETAAAVEATTAGDTAAATVGDAVAAESATAGDAAAAAPGGTGLEIDSADVVAESVGAPVAEQPAAEISAAAEVPTVETPAAEAPAAETAATAPAKDAAPKFEEIWRPRRRGRVLDGSDDRAKARPHQHRPGGGDKRRPQQPQAARPHARDGARDTREGHEARGDRDDKGSRKHQHPRSGASQRGSGPRHHRDGGKPRREDRPRATLHAGPPGAKASGFDPDSPFAALSQLKAAMDKRTQE